MGRLNAFFLRTWQRRGLAAQWLRPAAALYGFLLRRKAQRFVPSAIAATPAFQRPPIIVVGNMVVGGVGKTPVLMALVQHLQSLGYQPGVVSRGYGRQVQHALPVAVLPSTPAALAGDEALLIAQNTGVPVFVAADRVAALQALCAAHPGVDIVLSDDGLQHWALARDVEILVWDARGQGNGWLLPAGMLREPWPRPAWHPYARRNAQALHLYAGQDLPAGLVKQMAWPVTRALASYALDAAGQRYGLPALAARTEAPLAAVAGIAQPAVFFAGLRTQALALQQTVALPDHADVAAWWRALPAAQQQWTWLCTQKDAVKLWAVAPQALAVPLEISLPAEFYAALASALDASATLLSEQPTTA